MLNSQKKHASYRKRSYDRLKSREITFQPIQEKSLLNGVSDGLQISMNAKDIPVLIIHYYLLRALNTTQIFPLNHNVRFLPCQHRGVGIIQYVYALKPMCASF